MPMHDWTRVRAGTYHHFHYRWIAAIADALNTGSLPRGYFALAEQRVQSSEPDVVTLELTGRPATADGDAGGLAVETVPPRTRFVMETDSANYARRANRLTIRHAEGEVVAVIEIVSPGNKDSRHAIQSFVAKSIEFLDAGLHLLIVDPFPPTPRDPQGVHGSIWDEIGDKPFKLPADKPLTSVSYEVGEKTIAYVEPFAVGDVLPDMPLYLAPGQYVRCPLETTYQTTWRVFPEPLKGQLVGGH
ncbi:MAG TPA: DUF4058 family protein [Gemmataceae bacterium]|nr:DUF4058 family protein [Gemmataceae bacterium]